MILLSSYVFLQAENSTSSKPEGNLIILQRDGKSNHKTSKYVHCNWGWGGADNGYFLEGVYDTDKGVEYPTRYDFRYNVQGCIYK